MVESAVIDNDRFWLDPMTHQKWIGFSPIIHVVLCCSSYDDCVTTVEHRISNTLLATILEMMKESVLFAPTVIEH